MPTVQVTLRLTMERPESLPPLNDFGLARDIACYLLENYTVDDEFVEITHILPNDAGEICLYERDPTP